MIVKPMPFTRPIVDELRVGDILRYKRFSEVYDVVVLEDANSPEIIRLGERESEPLNQMRTGNLNGFTHSRSSIPKEFFLVRESSEFATLRVFRMLSFFKGFKDISEEFNKLLIETDL